MKGMKGWIENGIIRIEISNLDVLCNISPSPVGIQFTVQVS
jgi:hypothetical protein